MSSDMRHTRGAAPPNIAALLREPFRAITEDIHARLREAGHPEVRVAHGTVMQFLDDDGTRVSVLAERARMTKQSMAELVAHLERHGHVERVPDPSDRRAKLVRPTSKGRKLFPVAEAAIAAAEQRWTEELGKAKMKQLRGLLEELNAVV